MFAIYTVWKSIFIRSAIKRSELNKKKTITRKREKPIGMLSGLCDWDVFAKKQNGFCIVADRWKQKFTYYTTIWSNETCT